jgi:hypothetical protein
MYAIKTSPAEKRCSDRLINVNMRRKQRDTRNAIVSFSFYSWLDISFEPRDPSRRQTKVDDYWVIQLKMGEAENGTFGKEKK